MAKYNIRAVATKTGLNPATLRTWERRYNAVAPVRESNGSRAYTEASVRRVHLLKQATERGHAIRHLARLDDGALESLLNASPVGRNDDRLVASCVEQLLNSIDAMDVACFERVVTTAALAFSPVSLMEDVISPTLEAVGDRWREGRLSVAQEHAVSASLSSVLGALIRSYPIAADGPLVVLATLPGERHELGLLMSRYVLVAAGVRVTYLGVDLPVSEIAAVARQHGASAVQLSAIHGEGAVSQRAALGELLTLLPADIEVWVGGAQCDAVVLGVADGRVRCVRSLRALEQSIWKLRSHA